MTIKSNTLGHNDPLREFALEKAGSREGVIEKEPDYDRELFELLGEKSSLIISTSTSEVIRILRFSEDITDEEIHERLVDVLCNSNDGTLNIGQKTEDALETMGLKEEGLEMAKQLVQGRINLEIRSRVTSLLNKLDCVATGNSPKA